MNNKKTRNDNNSFRSTFAGLVIAGLLILTAWGNATAMLVISAITLVWLLLSRSFSGQAWPMMTGLIASAVVALNML